MSPARATAAAVLLALVVSAGCGGSKDDDSASTTSSTRPAVTTSAPTTSSAPSADGRAEAVRACRTWGSAGSEPDPSAISSNAIQVRAAGEAAQAAAIDPSQWQALATAMKDVTALPLTGLTPEQEEQGAGAMAAIYAQCHLLGADLP